MVQGTQGTQGTQEAPVAPSKESLELQTLERRRGELRGQLSGITERRSLLTAQLHESEGATRGRLAQRIEELDARTARIDNELNTIDDRVSALLARGVALPPSAIDRMFERAAGAPGAPRPPGPPGEPGVPAPGLFPGAWGLPASDPFQSEWGELFGGMLALQGLTFVLLGVVLWRSFRRSVAARLSGDDKGRLEQLQRSVDVVAVEVERISEAQRFTAKLLNDQTAQPARMVNDAERVR